jgi:hypothetical protein
MEPGHKQLLKNILEITFVERNDLQKSNHALNEIQSQVASVLEICPQCGNGWPQHNDDGSCVEDNQILTEEQKQQYIKYDGNHCPWCESSAIEAGRLNNNWPLKQQVFCRNCEKVWWDTLKVTDIEEGKLYE